ncbi:hypothetical protein LTR97_003283 [Elasticomyces elasticus]|uniref:Carbohydrate kinase PfkB domain-containing protein n=1 Tax=Elasticomyces elasticus TaxID=574655 RepID=A0AAN7VVJ0_9PEZI|nr:hypothetical protein LTR97_003283 [Elasticomyces elasticus]
MQINPPQSDTTSSTTNTQPTAANTRIRLVALGNGVWLDDICRAGCEPVKNVPGGSVTFATLGARLFAADEPSRIAMTFNAGHDFPEDIIDVFRSWDIDLTIHKLHDKPSSRGLVFYEEANNNRKGFQRLTEPLPVPIKDLKGTLSLKAQSFEFFGTAQYIEEQVADLVKLRWDKIIRHIRTEPFIVWEPHPKSCTPDTLKAHQEAAKLVDVFSPNHEELHSFFGEPVESVDTDMIEEQARSFVKAGIGPMGEGCIVVRAAGHGCLIMARHVKSHWLPPYYLADSDKVVDATGAGNAFLGAFAVGFCSTGSNVEAGVFGTVAASFALEQVGLPVRVGEGDEETWNGCLVMDRVHEYRQRLKLD